MRDRLKRAFPKTPSSFETRMEQVLADLPKRRSRRNLRRTAAAMLAAAVAMGGLAVAATHSQLLDALFPTQPPTPQAENLVVELGMAAEAANATLTIEEYLLDGADLYVRWNVTSTADEPLMLMVSDVQTPYAAQSILDQNFCAWDLGMGVLLTPDYPSHSEVSRIHFDEEVGEGAFEATLTAALLKPIAPIKDDSDLSDFSDTPTLLKSDYSDSGLIRLNAVCNLEMQGKLCYMADSEDLNIAMGRESSFDAMMRAMETCGYAEEQTRIPVRFVVSPDAENIVHTQIIGQNVFAFDRYTMIVDHADFTAAGVDIRYRLIPSDEENPEQSIASQLWFDVLPDGHRTENEFIQGKSVSGSTISGEIIARAESNIPSKVRLIPYIEETNQKMIKYAVELELRTVSSH